MNSSEGEGTSQEIQKFLQQKPGSQHIKRLLFIKEKQTSQVNEFSALYEWKDARVWAH